CRTRAGRRPEHPSWHSASPRSHGSQASHRSIMSSVIRRDLGSIVGVLCLLSPAWLASSGSPRRERKEGNAVPMPGPDRASQPVLRWAGVCLDCRDAGQMARFYGELFGWTETARDEPSGRRGGTGWILMSGPDGGPAVSLQAEECYEPPV